MKKYKNLLFDLDGTLIDTDLLVIDAFVHTFQTFLPHYKLSLRELVSFLGPTLKDTFSKYLTQDKVQKAIEYFVTFSKKNIAQYAILYDGVYEALEAFKSNGIKLAIITSKMKESTKVTLSCFNLDKYFDAVITLDDVDYPKPNPQGILKAIDVLNGHKEDTLYIGDNLSDKESAVNAGVDFGLVTWSIKKIETEAQLYISSYKELKEVILDGKKL